MARHCPWLLGLVIALPGAGAAGSNAPVLLPEWSVSLQVGMGRLEEDSAALLAPSLSYRGPTTELLIVAPLWLQLEDVRPDRSWGRTERGPGGGRWLLRLDDADTYSALVARLSHRSDSFRLFVGSLNHESVGHGVLVDAYTSSLDPTRPRSGARVEIQTDSVAGTLLVDSFFSPHLLAGEVRLHPLRWVEQDPHGRLMVTAEIAADPTAPRTAADGTRDSKAVVGGGATLSLLLHKGARSAAETYLSGSGLLHRGAGMHAGLRLEVCNVTQAGPRALTLRVEGISREPGYVPGYFDVAYETERRSVPAAQWHPKASVPAPGGGAVRWALDAEHGPLRFGVAGQTVRRRGVQVALHAKVAVARWSAALLVLQRHVTEGGGLVHLGDSTYAALEAAYRLHGGLFAFAGARHGWREDRAGVLRIAADWIVGVGCAADGSSTNASGPGRG